MTATVSNGGVSHTNFRDSFKWSNLWINKIRTIVGAHLLRPSTVEEDTQEATDLIMLRAEAMRVACRLRKPGYVPAFAWDVTFTARRENGFPCEWDKLVIGKKANWFFYGHASTVTPEGRIHPWFLIDVDMARPYLLSRKWIERGPNKDELGRRCWFYAFDLRNHPALQACLIYSKPISDWNSTTQLSLC